MSGRSKSSEWDAIELKTDTVTKKKTGICKYCRVSVTCKIERIKSHLKKCMKYLYVMNATETGNPVPANISDDESTHAISIATASTNKSRSLLDNDPLPSTSSSQFYSSMVVDDTRDPESEIKKRKLLQPNCNTFVTKTSKTQKHNLDILVAKFFYGANIAFRQVESRSFM